jgi:TonB family protein
MKNSKSFAKHFAALACALFFCGSLNLAFAQEGFKGSSPTVYKRPVKKTSHATGASTPARALGKSVEFNNKGDEYFDQGKYAEAIDAYQQAIKLKPNYAEAFFNMGDAYEALEHHEEAVTAYQQAIRFKPNYDAAYFGLADAYQALGKSEEAGEAYSHANSSLPAGGIMNGKALSLPQPVYPPIARAVHASGTVVVAVVLDETGQVIRAQAISGHPLLQASAVQAASQAKFTPTKIGGQPVKVSGTINYNFVLQ